jgi:hypothetical protein
MTWLSATLVRRAKLTYMAGSDQSRGHPGPSPENDGSVRVGTDDEGHNGRRKE